MNTEKIQQVINAAVQAEKIVGTSVLVALNGELIFSCHAGFADRENRIPVTENTIFRLASMTKPMVSVAALALAEKNIFSLNDPVTKWLQTFTPRLANGDIPVITIKNLLTHTAGLTYGFLSGDNEPYYSAGVSDGLDESVLSIQENIQKICSVPLQFEPGTAWCYSVATDVLGAVMEKATGKSLAEIINQYVTAPLNMHDTDFQIKKAEHLAQAYASNGNHAARRMTATDKVLLEGCGFIHYSPERIINQNAYHSGGAGMAGTAHDYLRFLEAIRLGGQPLLQSDSMKLLTHDMVPGFDVPAAGPGYGFSMGFAVVRDAITANTPRNNGSYDWGGVYGTKMFVDPRAGLSVVMLTNTALEGLTGQFPADVTQAIYHGLN